LVRSQGGRQPDERVLAAQLVAQPVVVADVVAVRAAGGGLEERRGVAVADAERLQVVQQRRRVVEGQPGPELQAVRRARYPRHAGASRSRWKPSCSPTGASSRRAWGWRRQVAKKKFCAAQRP